MRYSFVLLGFLVFISFQYQSSVIAGDSSSSEEHGSAEHTSTERTSTMEETTITRPPLPAIPTIGGKLGNPGALLRIAKGVLVSNVQQACRDAEKKKPENRAVTEIVLSLPDGQLVISQLRLISLTLPLVLGNVYPPNQLYWCIDNGRLSASGLWSYTSNNDSHPINYTGTVYVAPTMYSANVNATLGRTPENQPAITTTSCQSQLNLVTKMLISTSSQLGVTKMLFSTSTSEGREFIGELESNATLVVKDALEEYVCEVITTALRLALNSLLTTFKTKIDLWNSPKVILDYSLISDPYVDPVDSSINGKLKGLISVNGASSPSFYPHDFPKLDDAVFPTVAMQFSDFMLNSLFHSTFQARMMHLTATCAFSKKVADFLRLDCQEDDLCVGSVFPSCCNTPQNSTAELTAMATQAPTAIFLESGAYMQMSGSFSVDIRMQDSKVHRCFSSPFSLVAVLIPSAVVQKEQTETIVSMEAKIEEIRLMAAIPGPAADADETREKIVSLVVPILEEMMNKPFALGIPTPSFNATGLGHFPDPCLLFFNRTLIVHQCRP